MWLPCPLRVRTERLKDMLKNKKKETGLLIVNAVELLERTRERVRSQYPTGQIN
jgi:hypothetical protein